MPAPDPSYVPPDCPGEDPAGDWIEMGWSDPVSAAISHLAWCHDHQPGAIQRSPAIRTWKEGQR